MHNNQNQLSLFATKLVYSQYEGGQGKLLLTHTQIILIFDGLTT